MAYKKKIILKVFLVCLFLLGYCFFVSSVSAAYVLPYPSSMPGSRLYLFEIMVERISSYWYFGSFAQFKYNLKLADKYLVESKILFEYGQYYLAIHSLQKSDVYYSRIENNIVSAQKEKKDISLYEKNLKDASLMHIEVLNKLEKELPKIFVWKPEKGNTTTLMIHERIKKSINLRSKII